MRVGAVAFSLGADLFFSPGAYAPEDPAGRRLLAHEVAHALQPAPVADGPAVWLLTDEAAEAEADRVVDQVTADRPDADALRCSPSPRRRRRPPVVCSSFTRTGPGPVHDSDRHAAHE